MPAPDHSKATCPACNGHVEFPSSATGNTVPCPHCQAPMTLVAMETSSAAAPVKDAKASLGLSAPILAVMVAMVTGTVILLIGPNKDSKKEIKPVATNAPAATKAPSEAELPLPEGWQRPILPRTGDLELLGFKLENQPGTSLKHVIGLVTNRSSGRYFGVKVEFNMVDGAGSIVGQATDQTTSVMGHSSWQFRALSVGGKPEKASPAKLSGEKE
jgi:hypothetical protein